MTRFRHSTATAIVAMLLAGCTGEGAAAPARSTTTSPTPAAKASPPAAHKSMEQILSDIHHAAEGIGEDRIRFLEDGKQITREDQLCHANGLVLTPHVPGRPELLQMTNRLKGRGWKLIGDTDPVQDLAILTSSSWQLVLGNAKPLPKHLAARSASKGMIGVSVIGRCLKA
ncbi:hypothetical protein ACWGI8_06700 [Streptomyces sp. NPDC054841]